MKSDRLTGLINGIEDCFSSLSYTRGRRIFSASLVGPIEEDEDGYSAIVCSETSSSKRYRSSLLFDGNQFDGSFCTCPVGQNCKHAAAVAIKLIKAKGATGQNRTAAQNAKVVKIPINADVPRKELTPPAPDQSPLLKPASFSRDPLHFKRTGGNGEAFLRALSPRAMFPQSGYMGYAPAQDTDRWALAYCLEYDFPSGFNIPSRNRIWTVKRILQYRKLDGSPGRLKDWAPGYVNLPVPADALALESLFLAENADVLSAESAGMLAAALCETPLFLNESGTLSDARQVKPVSVSKAHLSFNPLEFSDGTVYYNPVFSFYVGDDERLELSAPVTGAFYSGGATFYTGKGKLYIASSGPLADIRLAMVLQLAPENSTRIRHEETFPLVHAVTQVFGEALNLLPPPSHVEKLVMTPETEVLIEILIGAKGQADTLRFTVLFSYHGAVMTKDETILRREGDTLELMVRNAKFEDESVEFFRRILGKRAHANPVNPRVVDLACGMGEFAKELYKNTTDAGYRFFMKSEGARKPLKKAKLAASISSTIDWFEATLRLDVDGEGNPLDGQIIFLGGDLISTGGQIYALDGKDRSLITLLAQTRNAKTGGYRVDKRDLARVAALHESLDEEAKPVTESAAELYRVLSGLIPVEDTPPPVGFKASFRPYQASGYSWLMRLLGSGLGALLADDMGLGKTIQAIAVLQKLREGKLLKPALIVAPVTVLSNWESELERFAPNLKVARHHGPARVKDGERLSSLFLAHDIVLTSYQTLRSDEELFAAVEYGMVLIDEAQAIKNPDAGASRAVCALRSRARLALTGTPVENRPLDLWSHFNFLNPGLLDSRRAFIAECEKPISTGDADSLELLKRRITPFILRRKKEDVLDDLPAKEVITRFIDMDGAQKSFYEALRRQCANSVQSAVEEHGVKKSAIYVLEALLRLRQAAIHPALIGNEHAHAGGAKLKYAADLIAELVAEGHRVLVFSQFTGALGLLKASLDEEKITYEYLDGQTKDRAERISRFQADSGGGVFLLSLKAGGVGINLTNADYVILLDPWWNPAAESQAIDRAHRIGQTRKVTVYRLVSRGTVEEKVTQLQDKKRRLVEELVSETGDGLAGFSGQEILALFEEETP